MLAIVFSGLVVVSQAVTKTIGPIGSGADYEMDGILDDDVFFQRAICDAKGEVYDHTLDYKGGYNTCGFKHPGTRYDPYPAGDLILDIMPGTYNMNRQLYIYSNTELRGAGIGSTTLKLKDNAISFYQKFVASENYRLEGGQAGFMRCFWSDNITFTGITFDGNKDNQTPDSVGLAMATVTNGRTDPYSYGRFAVYTEASENIIIDSCEVKNWQGYGLDPHGEGGTNEYGEHLIVSNNVVHNNDWDGITIDKTRYFECFNNHAYNNGRHGINLVTGTEEGTVYNNLVENNGHFYDKERDGIIEGKGCGIMAQNNQLYGTSDINIYNNTVTGSNYAGICLHSVYSVEVYDNEIKDGQNWCVRLALQSQNPIGAYRNKVYDNNCDHPRGIYLTKDSYNNTVKDNLIKVAIDNYGVSNRDEHDSSPKPTNKICDNTFSGTVVAGAEVYYSNGRKQQKNCDGSDPTPVPPPAPAPADPTCANGIMNGDVCCLSSCGSCGGSGCSSRTGGSDGCCVGAIRDADNSCTEQGAPCVLSSPSNPVVTPDPNCDNGIEASGACCPVECGTCGGSGCSQRYFGASYCCTGTIKNQGESCATQSAPCYL